MVKIDGIVASKLTQRRRRVPAIVIEEDVKRGTLSLETTLSPTLHVTLASDLVMSEVDGGAGGGTDCNNLLDLRPVNNATVEMNLMTRFLRDTVYTALGDVLIAMNPYGPVKEATTGAQLYDHSAMLLYYARTEMSDRDAGAFDIAPHIYGTAGAALLAARRDRVDQSIIIMGESGSGKTENWRHALRYISYSTGLPSSDGRDVSPHSRALRRLITEADVVLQAFGNAVTLNNANSSRYGCAATFAVDSNGGLRGVSFATSQLEASRITATPDNERLFRVFYAVCARAGGGGAECAQLTVPRVVLRRCEVGWGRPSPQR